MKIFKVILLAIAISTIAVFVTNRFITSKYPSCDLVEKGIGLSTYGCSNNREASSSDACINLAANSPEITKCVKDNYYKYKTFPFGFKQEFGGNSNVIDYHPKINNEILTFLIVFIIVIGVSLALKRTKTH